MPECLTMLTPKGIDLTSVGRSSIRNMTPSDIAACMCDLTPVQEMILLGIANNNPPGGKGLHDLHLRACRIMLKEGWIIKDTGKPLLKLTKLGFINYISVKPLKTGDMARFMGISRYKWHRYWSKKFDIIAKDFDRYLSEQERDGNRAFYMRYVDEC